MIPSVPTTIVRQPPQSRDDCAVSVITPAYNPGPELFVTVASLNAQTLRDFAWILVDDCSDEKHAPVIAQACAAATFPLTVLRHTENARQGQARNTGLARARAPFIKFLDADDALDPPHLERLLAAARVRAAARRVVFAPTRHLFLARNKILDNNTYRDVGDNCDTQLAHMLTAPFLHHCGALFPRELLVDLNGYDPSLVTDEDGDLLLRVLLAGWRFEAVPDIFYIYRHHDEPGRASRDDTREKIAARKAVGERVSAHFSVKGEPTPDVVKAALCRRLDALAVRNWRSRPEEARACLAAAHTLDAEYTWSGSKIEHAVRRVAGIATAHRLVSALRAARGISFH